MKPGALLEGALWVVVLAAWFVLWGAGCDGRALEGLPAADAGADVIPAPDAGPPLPVVDCVVPVGVVFTAAPCTATCAACSQQSPTSFTTIADCHPPFQPTVTCAARCSECAP